MAHEGHHGDMAHATTVKMIAPRWLTRVIMVSMPYYNKRTNGNTEIAHEGHHNENGIITKDEQMVTSRWRTRVTTMVTDTQTLAMHQS